MMLQTTGWNFEDKVLGFHSNFKINPLLFFLKQVINIVLFTHLKDHYLLCEVKWGMDKSLVVGRDFRILSIAFFLFLFSICQFHWKFEKDETREITIYLNMAILNSLDLSHDSEVGEQKHDRSE